MIKPIHMARRRRISIRSKFLLIVLAIFTLPWVGIRYVNEMKNFLLQGQEDALALTAKAVSTVLTDRDELFRSDTGVPELLGGQYDLYAHQLAELINLDGDPADWGAQLQRLTVFTGSLSEECNSNYQPDNLSLRHTLGYKAEYLYALFLIDDNSLVFRDTGLRNLNHSDQIRLSIQAETGEISRYLLLTRKPTKKTSRMSVYLMDEDWRYPLTGQPISEINATFFETETGYNIEVRLPRFLVSSETRVGFELIDVDDIATHQVDSVITTYPKSQNSLPGRVLLHSPELAKILGGLDRQIARIWILDKEQRVRAVVGSLGSRDGLNDNEPLNTGFGESLQRLYNRFFDWILRIPSSDFQDLETSITHLSDVVIDQALIGNSQSRRRSSIDNRAQILIAANPILSGNEVIGAVVVEQSANEVLKLQHQALKSIAAVTLGAFILITLVIFIFATRLTIRIRKLHLATEQSITAEGRVRKEYMDAYPAGGGDEIGDLTVSISGMLGRLSQYTRYLEAMPDTLAHELNNPLNVVSSSLEILSTESPETKNNKYMLRAMKGVQRLRSILTSLTEAANLEEAMQYEDYERFDLCELVEGCTEGYQISFPAHQFNLKSFDGSLWVSGAPDRIAQLLDKLIDNAVQFGNQNDVIDISIEQHNSRGVVQVRNRGSLLPEEMSDRLFDPMVSVGSKDATQSHLGLGLFIVRLITDYHKGQVRAENQSDPEGVAVTVELPLEQAA
ncbi:MAG: two-component system sensor histidine kinase ChvG [Gammaproteobacteria bacterium]|jgi:two-component system sensor histidine kinase ChvG